MTLPLSHPCTVSVSRVLSPLESVSTRGSGPSPWEAETQPSPGAGSVSFGGTGPKRRGLPERTIETQWIIFTEGSQGVLGGPSFEEIFLSVFRLFDTRSTVTE